MKRLLVLFILFALAVPVKAQWSSDSLQNLAIVSYTGEQTVPKIVATSDGGCYVSWYDNRNGNYDVYLQRLNANGQKQWSENGLLISNHPQQSWVTDYDLKVDQEDNAILVFNDVRNGDAAGWDVFAYKIAPDGSFLWGADGVGLSAAGNTYSEMAPKVAVTTDTNYVFVWSIDGDPNKLGLQKLSKTGQKLWGADGKIFSGANGEGLSHPQIVAALDDSVIVAWMAEIGTYPATKIWLVAQKLDPAGNKVWNSDVIVYNNGDIPSYKDFQLTADGQSGTFLAWEEHPGNESYLEVGHIAANGELLFPQNGIKTSTSSNALHYYPNMDYVPSLEALYVFWQESNLSQTENGIYGQRFNLAGERLWSDTGKVFVPLQSVTRSYIAMNASGTHLYVSYLEGEGLNRSVRTFYSDANGNIIWGPEILSAASLGNKSNLEQTVTNQGSALLAWRDERNDDPDIYGQNVHSDGSLGNAPSSIQSKLKNSVQHYSIIYNYPNPFNPLTHIIYSLPQSSHVKLVIFNSVGQKVAILVDEKQKAGQHEISFNAQSLPTGLYFYRLQTQNRTLTGKMIYLR